MNKKLYANSPIYKQSFDVCAEVIMSHFKLLELDEKSLKDFNSHLYSMHLEKLIEYELMMRGFAMNKDKYEVKAINVDDMMDAVRYMLKDDSGKHIRQSEHHKMMDKFFGGNPIAEISELLKSLKDK